MALIAGNQAPQGRVMGHAGAFVGAGENDARSKVRALEDAGVVITNHPSKFGEGMKALLAGNTSQKSSVSTFGTFWIVYLFIDVTEHPFTPNTAAQKRHVHTLRRPVLQSETSTHTIPQRRMIYIPESQSNRMLKEMGVTLTESEDPRSRDYFLTVTVDRSKYTPCIITSPSIGGKSYQNHAKTYPLGLDKQINRSTFSSIATDLDCEQESFASLEKILSSMVEIFFNKEASSLTTRLSCNNNKGELSVAGSMFLFDDAAFRSGKRHGDIQAMRDTKDEVPEEVEAEKDGIVYIR